jgi:hypothetical protein
MDPPKGRTHVKECDDGGSPPRPISKSVCMRCDRPAVFLWGGTIISVSPFSFSDADEVAARADSPEAGVGSVDPGLGGRSSCDHARAARAAH